MSYSAGILVSGFHVSCAYFCVAFHAVLWISSCFLELLSWPFLRRRCFSHVSCLQTGLQSCWLLWTPSALWRESSAPWLCSWIHYYSILPTPFRDYPVVLHKQKFLKNKIECLVECDSFKFEIFSTLSFCFALYWPIKTVLSTQIHIYVQLILWQLLNFISIHSSVPEVYKISWGQKQWNGVWWWVWFLLVCLGCLFCLLCGFVDLLRFLGGFFFGFFFVLGKEMSFFRV